ncbi:MAG TPA: hypothetical protein VFY67_10970 [Pyrinomonadaceae bacterium]|nr:hypothetical protein [Pyrinomonadaceae bacterium]
MKKYRYVLLGAAALLLMPLSARAQFRGDVFFAQPSVSAPAGGVAVLEVQTFSGSDVVGATHIDIIFDSARADVVAVEPGNTSELVDGVASHIAPGRVGIVTLNGKSLLQPFGTVSLAKVRVKPLVAAGERVTLSIQVRSLLRQDATPFPSFRGFAGEILVVSPANSSSLSSSSGAIPMREDKNAVERARTFRRPGIAIDLLDFEIRRGEIYARARQIVVPGSDPPNETEAPRWQRGRP